MRQYLFFSLWGLFMCSQANALESRPVDFTRYVSEGDTLAFFGDSITHAGQYPLLIQTFFSTRYPELKIWTENVGRSGDTAKGSLENRLEGDLWTTNPDVVFIHFGMNDVRRASFRNRSELPASVNENRQSYQENMEKIVMVLKSKNIEAAIISPTLFDDNLNRWDNTRQSPLLNGELAYYGQIGYELADKSDLPFFDVHTPLTDITEEEQRKDETFSFTQDRVHPRRGGEHIMAWKILKDMQVDPNVYDLTLSVADEGTILSQHNVEVDAITLDAPDKLTWSTRETRLPFPVEMEDQDSAFTFVDFQATLNRMTLKVKGLATGEYQLSVNGTVVKHFTAEALEAGVNLADVSQMPQVKEARNLREGLIAEKGRLQELLRDLNSYRLSLNFNADDIPGIKEIDWSNPDAEKVVALRQQQLELRESQGRNNGAYFAYITKQGNAHVGEIPEIRRRLLEIRNELATLPLSRAYTYSLERISS